MRDEFEVFFQDAQFADLFPPRGRPAEAPWRLLLVSVLQYAEGLSDRQAAEAVRRCLDWKYLLALPLTDPGFDASVLCEFRTRLLAGGAELRLLDLLLARFREQGLLKARGVQRTDSTHVLAAIRILNRLELLGETMRHALNTLAETAPEWLTGWLRAQDPDAPAAWSERYGRRFETYRLPRGRAEREALALAIGEDGFQLLAGLTAPETPAPLPSLPAVRVLARVWRQQFYYVEERLRWRTAEELPPAPLLVQSPYDPEAHYSDRSDHPWVGYREHVTETCDPEQPRRITDVQTTPAPTPDVGLLPQIQARLHTRDLLPAVQLVDCGYVEATVLVSAPTEYGVDVLGPTLEDRSWQAREGTGFAAAAFQIDWKTQRVRCPAGKQSIGWAERPHPRHPERAQIRVDFSQKDCGSCPHRPHCTQGARRARRLTLQPEAAQEALVAARVREQTLAFAEAYRARAGVEATHAQAVRRCGVRRCRYLGLAKTHLQHLLTAAALNFARVGEWLLGNRPAKTRTAAFVRLATPCC